MRRLSSCMGFNSPCAVWPCVPCIRAFKRSITTLYRLISSGVYGPFMRSVYALLCYGPIGAFMLFRRSGCMSSNTAFNAALWLSVRRLVAFIGCLCISVWWRCKLSYKGV